MSTAATVSAFFGMFFALVFFILFAAVFCQTMIYGGPKKTLVWISAQDDQKISMDVLEIEDFSVNSFADYRILQKKVDDFIKQKWPNAKTILITNFISLPSGITPKEPTP